MHGHTPEHWYDTQDSMANVEWIEAVYNGGSYRFFLVCLALTIVHRSLGWDHVQYRQPRCRVNSTITLRICTGTSL